MLTREVLADFIQSDHSLAKYGQIRMVVVGNELRVGIIDMYDANLGEGVAWVGIIIHPLFRRQGYAREAINLLKQEAALSGIKRLKAKINNDASGALFRSAGFTASDDIYTCTI